MKRLLLGLLALLGACDETDSKGWLVDRARLLGALAEATTEPTRAALVVGEQASVTWLVASPTPLGAISYAWAACAPPAGSQPTPRCEGTVLASGTGTASAFGLVGAPLTVPGVAGDEVYLLGAFCPNGSAPPILDAAAFQATCAEGTALLGTTTLRLGGGNHNPPIGEGDVLLDGVAIPPATIGPVDATCAGEPGAPIVLADGREHQLGFQFRDEQRETDAAGKREALVVTHVISTGELDRQYSALDPDAAPGVVTVTWTAPTGGVPEAGRIIETFFVLRDGRGGTTFARRTLCVRLY